MFSTSAPKAWRTLYALRRKLSPLLILDLIDLKKATLYFAFIEAY